MASQPSRRGFSAVEWTGRGAELVELGVGLDDSGVVDLLRRCDLTGVDVPLGWPSEFVEFHSGGSPRALSRNDQAGDRNDQAGDRRGSVAGAIPSDGDTRSILERLRFRRTDLYVRDVIGRLPLSVSSDLIAVPAMRMQIILRRAGSSLASRLIEVYPAAALARWDLPSSGYKGSQGGGRRGELVAALAERLEPKIRVSPAHRDLMSRSDDALDAFVCALVARAWQLGMCDLPPDGSEPGGEVAREGWIAVPLRGSLARISSGDLLRVLGSRPS